MATLEGVRVAVKDLFDVAGMVTGAGNPTLAAGPPASRDAAAVTALRAAGAQVVAKVATDELAMGMFGVNSHYGTPANPAAPDRVPGGSSSGSASAVAAGDADLGLGTDTGGSIRVPASFCGLVGLRPTHGRISLEGVRPMAPGFDTVGLLAAEVSDVADAFGALAGPVAESAPGSAAVLASESASAPIAGSAAGTREVTDLVLLTDLVDRAEPAVAERTRECARAWADQLGLGLREVTLAAGENLVEIFWPLMSRQLWESNGAWVEAGAPVLGEGIAERIAAAGLAGDDEVAAAERARAELFARLAELLDVAIAVLPTTIDVAPLRTSTHAELMAFRDRNLALIVPASLCGAPQLTLPVGRDRGAPFGVSLLGLPDDDELLLTAAGGVL